MNSIHSFHIPVMGLAFTIDTPVKVAHFGISSVVSICDDKLAEDMCAYYSRLYDLPFVAVPDEDTDGRARRITAYLNLLDIIVARNFNRVREEKIVPGSDIVKYLELLDESSPLKLKFYAYREAADEGEKEALAQEIRQMMRPGRIDVNIMTKLDKKNYKDGVALPSEYTDALAALRGFAQSTLSSAVVFSAGISPRLYAYLDNFPDFYPSPDGNIRKKVILKVSDFRSAEIQSRFLAKKGIWVSAFRIESGLNCGGHAFATDGYLMGPILEEFMQKREALRRELFSTCLQVWKAKNIAAPLNLLPIDLHVQGGVGTTEEKNFLEQHYSVDSTGWGSPFLLVPEATTLDVQTRQRLSGAGEKDVYLSHASPLGVPFYNLRNSESEKIIRSRIVSGRPGSPCLKKYLVSNTEFTAEPICTASRKYQYFKRQQLRATVPEDGNALAKLEAKACLCEDLAAPAYITKGLTTKLQPATAICPGPNIVYFSGEYTLKQMVDHIYGRVNLLSKARRPHMFMKEFELYIRYLKAEIAECAGSFPAKKLDGFKTFKANLESGATYYRELIAKIAGKKEAAYTAMRNDLKKLERLLEEVILPVEATF